MNSLVVQFAKWPEAGKVKTRLAANIGYEKARDVHIQLMTHVLANISNSPDWDVVLSLSETEALWPHELLPVQKLLAAHKVQQAIQNKGSLGDKLASTFDHYSTKHDKVIIVGSDCPTITPDYIQSALSALDQSDVVLGPAEDGGYVLVGVKASHTGLFDNVEWGTEKVLEQTTLNIERLGLRCQLLEQAWDVDTLIDYQRFQEVYGLTLTEE